MNGEHSTNTGEIEVMRGVVPTGQHLITRRPVTWTTQGNPDTWLGHHNGTVVCERHATPEQAERFEPISDREIFDFEYDMGQRIVTIAACFDKHVGGE